MVIATAEIASVAVAVLPEVSVTITLLPVAPVELVRVIEGPFARTGAIVKLSFTFPAKVFRLVTVMVEELVEGSGMVNEAGLAIRVKSGVSTFRDKRVFLVAVPLMADTATL